MFSGGVSTVQGVVDVTGIWVVVFSVANDSIEAVVTIGELCDILDATPPM